MKKDGISGEKGMQKLGSADGKVDCTYCWTVKRDVFDIPMLIVMNVSTIVKSTWCLSMRTTNMNLVSALYIGF